MNVNLNYTSIASDAKYRWISFKYTPKKDLYFIELHLDMGGDFVLDHLLPKATNLNYPIDNFLEIYLFGKKNYDPSR